MKFEHVFNEMEIEADPFALCELNGRCDLGLGRLSGATLHYILSGHGEIILHDRPSIGVEQGSLVLIPALHSHTLRNFGEPGQPIPKCRPAELSLAQHLQGDPSSRPGTKLLAICSRVNVGLRGVDGLVELVREPLVESVGTDSAMTGPIEQLLQELSRPALGSRAMIRVLLLECMIRLLRKRLLARDPALDWMAVLVDGRLWSALRLMLDKPGDPHSVESLASAAGMSRSSFAERFSAAYGSGPMRLLRDLRMKRAGSLLEQTELPVKRIAEQVGFQSRSAFTRTFENVTGKTPRGFRAEARRNAE
ncbi:helix-turn-helix domain-containing protein [Hoeflea sp. TYP-13]|uniref:AraC family transcriptional regulator n=1 Tax=Hoeflea sp. TYP-13 TaxID=3230023 RepID=UPI0034C5E54F